MSPARYDEVLFADDRDYVLREVDEVLPPKFEDGLLPGLEHFEHFISLRLRLVLLALKDERKCSHVVFFY